MNISKKKILIIHHSGLLGGAGISLYSLWKGLLKEYNVTCYIPSDPSELNEFLRSKGLKAKTFDYRLGKITYYNGGNRIVNLKFWYHFLRIFFQFKKWKKTIEVENPDFIILNSIVLSWFAFLVKGKKSLIFVRETIQGNRKNPINRTISLLLDKFTMVSFLSKHDLNVWNLNKSLTDVNYNFYIPAKKTSNNKEETLSQKEINYPIKSLTLLYVGGFNRIKGVMTLIKAMNLLKDLNVKLIIAGNNPGFLRYNSIREIYQSLIHLKSKLYFLSARRKIERHNLEEKIQYVGVQENLHPYFRKCDILIVPTKVVHQARPIFEAGFFSKPVLITNFKNFEEFVINDYNGFLFKRDDSYDLSQKIRILFSDRKKLKELGLNNYELSLKNHTEETVIQNLIKKITIILKECNSLQK